MIGQIGLGEPGGVEHFIGMCNLKKPFAGIMGKSSIQLRMFVRLST